MVRNIEPIGGSVQVSLPQQVTMQTLPLLERQVDNAIAQQSQRVEMMGAAVQIADSAGLNWMLSARSRLEAAGIELRIVDPSAILGDILAATRLDSRFVMQQSGVIGGQRNA